MQVFAIIRLSESLSFDKKKIFWNFFQYSKYLRKASSPIAHKNCFLSLFNNAIDKIRDDYSSTRIIG